MFETPGRGSEDEPLREEDVTADDAMDEREREPLPSETPPAAPPAPTSIHRPPARPTVGSSSRPLPPAA